MQISALLTASLFIAGSAAIAFVSRKSLLRIRAHGFYRFFAWETLLAMLLRNVPGWFHDPLAWFQVISWILLITSLYLVIQSMNLLRAGGRSEREDPALLGLEKTSHLMTNGLYHYIRHPLYASLLFLGWGVFFKSPSWTDAALALSCTLFLIATARVEENENIATFGEEYSEYMKQTRMFVPYLF